MNTGRDQAKRGSVQGLAQAIRAPSGGADLWKRLVAIGDDPYVYSPLRTPTLVFESVSFAGV